MYKVIISAIKMSRPVALPSDVTARCAALPTGLHSLCISCSFLQVTQPGHQTDHSLLLLLLLLL
jgi:hypothetical protein